ncbi:MAG: hypothetical protein ACPLXM_13455 [Bacteroidales bacterium]
MRIFCLVISAIFLAILVVACDHDNDHDGLAGYPMKTGTIWKYERILSLEYYESELSGNIVRTDSFLSEVYVVVVRDTVLNGKAVKCFGAYDYPASFRSMEFFFEDTEGLKCYGYWNPGPVVYARKTGSVIGNLFSFRGLSGMVGMIEDDAPLFLEDPPTLNIKYPLKKEIRWTYRYPRQGMPLQIDKKAVGEEVLESNGKLYGCIKVEYVYMNSDIFSGLQMTDWIAEEGLVQRISTIDRVTLTTNGGDTLGTVRMKEILVLK